LLKKQIADITSNPENLKQLPHSTTIYHELLKPELYRDGSTPDVGSLYEESQALMFGGSDTTGTTLMHGCFYILKSTRIRKQLQTELREAWPTLEQPPPLSELEKQPFLVDNHFHTSAINANQYEQTAVIKEALRMSPGLHLLFQEWCQQLV
jgi:cytochrome P450